MFRAAFSPWGCARPSWSFAMLSSIRVVRGGRAGTPSSPYFYRSAIARHGYPGSWRSSLLAWGAVTLRRKVRMRFKVRSLGGKLIVVATCILLLCMLLFSVMSWSLLRFYSEHEAATNAQTDLSLETKMFQSHTPAVRSHYQQMLDTYPFQSHLSSVAILSPTHQVLAHLGTLSAQDIAPDLATLTSEATHGQTSISLRTRTDTTGQAPGPEQWEMAIALPVVGSPQSPHSALLALQTIDDQFAQSLSQRSGVNMFLCI